MGDSDLKYARLLQKQFETEIKGPSDDSLLAAELQEEFNHEFNCENAVGLSYDTKKKPKDDIRSLVDPSWELVDPTPNIHNLFMAFNESFFWNKLVTVCVAWSKRMTMCAGICSYQGRGGLCSITLSEPLLKLRPRKDLVETLLHEMIHAYLFLTSRNRDRDGHGPEFHEHMYRINKEAGTNITVYHSFHDEVRLYQQHWWRCNGPCQNRKPYFGMVRRAINRAPGPYDRWWNEHQQTCGGTFIKVREPEKQKTAQRKTVATPSNSNSDIRKYISSPKKVTSISGLKTSPKRKKPIVSPNRDIRSYLVNNSPFTPNAKKENIAEINKKNGDSPEIVAVFNNGNIHGYKGLGTSSKEFNKSNKGPVGLKSNNSSTVVVTSKQNTESKTMEKSENAVAFSGTGRVLSSNSDTQDYSKVRDHWLKKYDNSNASGKRQASDEVNETQKKKHQSPVIEVPDSDDSVACPICYKNIKISLSNEHIDQCLNKQFLDNKSENTEETCYVCNKKVAKSEYNAHVSSCFNNSFGDDGLENLVECPVCNMYFENSILEQHTIDCIEKSTEKEKKGAVGDSFSQCTVCSKLVESKSFDLHQEQCLHKMLDNIEEKYSLENSNQKIVCLVCKKKILKSELNVHLDECMSGVFDEKIPEGRAKNDDDDRSCNKNHNTTDDKYNCPFCMDLYSELDMSGHLEECLRSNNEQSDLILIESLSSDNF